MWKQIYAVLVLAGAGTTVGYGIASMEGGHLPYALGYTILLIFGVTTMWIVGANMFEPERSSKETEETKSPEEKTTE